jgi:tripartite-type tricarboxylate transporter receptor subunit TctC
MMKKIYALAAAFAPAVIAVQAWAADVYPTKSIRIVIGFAPGGYIDLTSRLVAGPLGAALGQQVVVDNRSGAGGVVGTEIVARSAPDGYTLTIGSIGTHAINQTLYRKLPYNVVKDFQPIARLSDAPNILAVHPSFPVKSVKDLIALARLKPSQIMYASAGAGTSTHIAAVLFEDLGHVKLVHVPYKGGGPALIDVVAGQVPVTFATAASVSPHTKSGRLRGIGITGSQRSTLLPDLPTIAESGLPGYEMINWLGLFAPMGTPRPVVDRLASESLRAVQTPEVRERLNAQGAEPSPLNTDQFTPFVKREVEKWAKVVTATGMTTD